VELSCSARCVEGKIPAKKVYEDDRSWPSTTLIRMRTVHFLVIQKNTCHPWLI